MLCMGSHFFLRKGSHIEFCIGSHFVLCMGSHFVLCMELSVCPADAYFLTYDAP